MTLDFFADQGGQPQSDPDKNYLDELVGEGKKFKTVEDLARGKFESDQYIDHFKARHDELKDDYKRLSDQYNAGPKLQEFIDKMTGMQTQQQSNSVLPEANDVQKTALDPKDLKVLMAEEIRADRIARQQQDNFKTVMDKLQERYGSSYQGVIKQQMEGLDMTPDQFNAMALSQPKTLMRTFGLDQDVVREGFQSPPRTTQPFAPKGAEKRTYAYYQKMRKDNPSLYRSAKIQDQMFKDAAALGDEFKDGTWDAY